MNRAIFLLALDYLLPLILLVVGLVVWAVVSRLTRRRGEPDPAAEAARQRFGGS